MTPYQPAVRRSAQSEKCQKIPRQNHDQDNKISVKLRRDTEESEIGIFFFAKRQRDFIMRGGRVEADVGLLGELLINKKVACLDMTRF